MSSEATACKSCGFAAIGLSRPLAAAYVGMGVTLFDRLVADGRMPRPRRVDGRLIWLRAEVERALEELPYDGAPRDIAPARGNSFAAIRARRQREGTA